MLIHVLDLAPPETLDSCLSDRRLSWTAKGLMHFLSHHHRPGAIKLEVIEAAAPTEDITVVIAALDELESVGYLTIEDEPEDALCQ